MVNQAINNIFAILIVFTVFFIVYMKAKKQTFKETIEEIKGIFGMGGEDG